MIYTLLILTCFGIIIISSLIKTLFYSKEEVVLAEPPKTHGFMMSK